MRPVRGSLRSHFSVAQQSEGSPGRKQKLLMSSTSLSEPPTSASAASTSTSTSSPDASGAAETDSHRALLDLLSHRRSVREYDAARPVSQATLMQLVEAARLAPSAGNLQAYSVHICMPITGGRHLFSKRSWINEAPGLMVFCALPEQSSEHYGSRGEQLYCIQDATIAATYAQLAAHSLGLVTCWIGAFHDKDIADAVGIADVSVERPILVLTIGYPPAHGLPEKSRKRRHTSDFVTVHNS
ncbi:FMN reductase [Pelomyxa schiedti]|nr:FMN reductase [Pelomyxa schiedti]